MLVACMITWLSIQPRLTLQSRAQKRWQRQLESGPILIEPPLGKVTQPEVQSQPDRLLDKTTAGRQIAFTAAPDVIVEEQPERVKTQKFHIVSQGQTLSGISKKYYGTEAKWSVIFQANRDVIKDPDRLKPGLKLLIPVVPD